VPVTRLGLLAGLYLAVMFGAARYLRWRDRG
jgi:hypothetical protein